MTSLFCLFGIINVYAQKNTLTDELIKFGFENIRISELHDTTYIAYENIAYRNEVDGLLRIMSLLVNSKVNNTVVLILLDKKVPQVSIEIPQYIMHKAIENRRFEKADADNFKCNTAALPFYRHLKDVKQYASSTGRIDLVFYPHIKIENVTFDKIWETQIGIDPAIQMQLWKGGHFTGQVKIPIYNDVLDKEGKYFRTGIIALTQDFALPKGWNIHLGAGLFSNNRQGITGGITYKTPKGEIEASVNMGYTGAIYWDNGKCSVYNWSKVNALASLSYFPDWQGLELKLQGGRYVYGDYGARFEIIRRFKNVGIGLFASYMDSDGSCGFNFSVPVGLKYYKRKGFMRVMPANYYRFEFNEKVGGKYDRKRVGWSYTDAPDENLIENCFNPQYLINGIKIAL